MANAREVNRRLHLELQTDWATHFLRQLGSESEDFGERGDGILSIVLG